MKIQNKGGGGLRGFCFIYEVNTVGVGATQHPNIYNTFLYGH